MDNRDIFFFIGCFFIVLFTNLSFASEKYYQNINAELEFRKTDLEFNDVAFEKMPTITGNILKVQAEPIIESSDISGVSINANKLTIFFNRDSWSKVRELSSMNIGSQLAFVKSKVIISSIPITMVFDRSALVLIPHDLKIDWFLKGFLAKDPPENLNSESRYLQFLQEWLVDHQNDIRALRQIVFHYLPNDDLSNCESAIPYFEKLLIASPDDYEMGIKFTVCLSQLDKNKKALKTATSLLQNISDSLTKNVLTILIGEIYYRLGRIDDAIEQTEVALNFYKNLETPDLSDWKNTPQLYKEQKKVYKLMKEEGVSELEKRLYQLKEEKKRQEKQGTDPN